MVILVISALAGAIAAWKALDSVTRPELLNADLMGTQGYIALLTAKGLVGASILAVCFGLARLGAQLMLPAEVVRDMARKNPDESGPKGWAPLVEPVADMLRAILDRLAPRS